MIEFPSGGDFTVGIEEELLLVDARELALSPDAARVLASMDMPSTAAGHEVYAAQIELRSPPARTTGAAVEALAGLRSRAVGAHALLVGAGVHPAGTFGDAPLVTGGRYGEVAETMRGLLRRTPESALHVHVGMPDLETAVRVFNALRLHMPLLQALAANSPFWFGRDSGLASARSALVRTYPSRGIPRALRGPGDWEDAARESLEASDFHDPTFVWWDLRLHPRHGTVELRELDAQSSLVFLGAIASLVRALAVEAASSSAAPAVPSEALSWSAFRASRDGVSGSVMHDGRLRPVRELALELAARLGPVARDLGDEEPLAALPELVARGGGAARQRNAFRQAGMPGLLRFLVKETSGVDAPVSTTDAAHTCKVVQEWLHARARCDLEHIAALTSERATWDSPVLGRQHGRAAVVAQVEAAFADTERFETSVLALDCRATRAAALVRNTGQREGKQLDSTQRLFLALREGLVHRVTIAVDDPAAVEAFWSDDTD
ncbi:MAG TPA: YbdK family carboxylate-amine ligase [Gaiellaceae bacterium]|nr:YbdK family carboxylate-amine ligase [Gaiellaceae bacterium]